MCRRTLPWCSATSQVSSPPPTLQAFLVTGAEMQILTEEGRSVNAENDDKLVWEGGLPALVALLGSRNEQVPSLLASLVPKYKY